MLKYQVLCQAQGTEKLKDTQSLPWKSSQLSKMGVGRVKILKSDLISLPAFDCHHYKTSGGRHL